jgi:hypothetical protein
MIICVENLTNSTKELLELISEVSNVAEYKINLQKSTVASNEQLKIKI